MSYRALAELGGIAKYIFALCVFKHRAFDRGHSNIIAVYLAAVVYGVAAYKGAVDADAVKEVEGLVSDDGTGRAADYSAADMNVKRCGAFPKRFCAACCRRSRPESGLPTSLRHRCG